MKILIHQCCGPCSIYLLEHFKKTDFEAAAYFYNPNIHPVTEYYKRLEAAIQVNNAYNIESIVDEYYGLVEFTRQNAGNESSRCAGCYKTRLFKTAEKAAQLGFEYFTSSLLYSKMQNHDLICKIATEAAKSTGTKFYYYDFRQGWDEGIKISKSMEIYRQNYCGCIYSEEDRFLKQLSGKFNKKYKNALSNK